MKLLLLLRVGAVAMLLASGLAQAAAPKFVVGWGSQVVLEPAGIASLDAIAAGGDFDLGLRDGSIVAWGGNALGACNVPAPNADFVAIAAGLVHGLGLKADGSIVAWGDNDFGQCNVPSPNTDFRAIAGGAFHSLGLKSDGTVVAWGLQGDGQGSAPVSNGHFVAVGLGHRELRG